MTTDLVWTPPDPGTWTLDLSHQTEPVTATAAAVVPAAHADGSRRCFARFGLPVSHLGMTHVNGWTYTSVFAHGAPRAASSPPPALVMKILTRTTRSWWRRTRRARRALAGDLATREADRWFRERDRWIAANLALVDVEPWDLDDASLADHVRQTAERLRAGMTLHFELMGPAIPVGEYLLAARDWGLDDGDAAIAAFHGTPFTREAGERLDALLAELGDSAPASLGAVADHSPRAADLLDDYLRHHGHLTLGDDLLAATVAELPDLVLGTIEARRRGHGRTEDTEARAAADRCRQRVSVGDRDRFDRLLGAAQHAYSSLDDNSAILAGWTAGLARRAQLAAGERLASRERLAAREDVWVLAPDEIAEALVGRGPERATVDARRVDRARWCAATPPPRLGAEPGPPPDPHVFPRPVASLTERMMAYMSTKFGDDATAVGVGSSVVRGRAVVVASPYEAMERIEPGDVLVTRMTTPAYNVVLPLLGALVTVHGGAASHPAVVAREIGLPAVVGWAPALERIADGDLVEVDPTGPAVRVIERAASTDAGRLPRGRPR